MNRILFFATLCGLTFCAAAQLQQPAFKAGERVLLEVLAKPDSPLDDKVTACQELGHQGTAEAVAPLAALLKDDTPPALFHAARYGLENIPDPAVDAAFLNAAKQLKGRALIGVLQSLGNRRAPAALSVLTTNASATDEGIASAAALALGKFGTKEAAFALKPLIEKNASAAEAYLACAGTLRDPVMAEELTLAKNIPQPVKLAALHELLLTFPEKAAAERWASAIRSDDKGTVDIALRTASELPQSKRFGKVFADALESLPSVRSRLCAVAAERKEPAIADALFKLVKDEPAATAALTRKGDKRIVPVLIDAIVNGDTQAKTALAAFSGRAADRSIRALFKDRDAVKRTLGIELVALRGMRNLTGDVLGLAGDPVQPVRDAAQKALADLIGAGDIPAVLALLEKHPDSALLTRAMGTLCAREKQVGTQSIQIDTATYGSFETAQTQDVKDSIAHLVASGSRSIEASNRLCDKGGFDRDPAPGVHKELRVAYRLDGEKKYGRTAEGTALWLGKQEMPQQIWEPLETAFNHSAGAYRRTLLKIIAGTETDRALTNVRLAATQDADESLREDAIRDLCEWNDPSALDSLASFAQKAPNDRLRILALRGWLRLMDAAIDAAPDKRAAALAQAKAWAVRDEDRQAVAEAWEKADCAAAEQGLGFTPIFNGKDLSGWEGSDNFWSVRDGVLTGESTPDHKVSPNHHIIWRGGEPADFDLVADFRISKSANSGIQLRSVGKLLNDDGYQPDMDGTGNYPGCIYHPKQGVVCDRGVKVSFTPDGKKTVTRFADSGELGKRFRIEDWNHYRIRCRADTITVWLNGVLMSQVTDPRREMLPDKGFITLQLHQGQPMKVEYKNILIRQ